MALVDAQFFLLKILNSSSTMSVFLWESKAQSGVNSLPSRQWQSQNQNSHYLPTCLPSTLAAEQVTQHEGFSDGRTKEQSSAIKYKQSENDQYESLNKQNSKKIRKNIVK